MLAAAVFQLADCANGGEINLTSGAVYTLNQGEINARALTPRLKRPSLLLLLTDY